MSGCFLAWQRRLRKRVAVQRPRSVAIKGIACTCSASKVFSKSESGVARDRRDMNLKTWGPDTSVTDSTRDYLPCCGNAGLTAKPLVADTACFDLLTVLDEDERGALRTAQNFESRVNSHYLRPQLRFSATRIFISIP